MALHPPVTFSLAASARAERRLYGWMDRTAAVPEPAVAGLALAGALLLLRRRKA